MVVNLSTASVIVELLSICTFALVVYYFIVVFYLWNDNTASTKYLPAVKHLVTGQHK